MFYFIPSNQCHYPLAFRSIEEARELVTFSQRPKRVILARFANKSHFKNSLVNFYFSVLNENSKPWRRWEMHKAFIHVVGSSCAPGTIFGRRERKWRLRSWASPFHTSKLHFQLSNSMPDSFFQKKRKRGVGSSRPRSAETSSSSKRSGAARGGAVGRGPPNSRRRDASDDDEDEDDDNDVGAGFDDDTRHRYDEDVTADEEREAAETPAEARVRMAKMYLEGLKSTDIDEDDLDAAAIDAQNIGARLQKDVSESSAKLHTFVADRLAPPPRDGSRSLLLFGGHRGALTAAVASNDGKWIYTAGKDGNVFRWRMEDGRIDVLMPRARKAGKGPARPFTNGFHHESEDESGTEAGETSVSGQELASVSIQDTSMSVADIELQPSLSKSKSSGASRRRARRQAAASMPQSPMQVLSNKGKGKAAEPGRLHDIVELDHEEGHASGIWSLALTSDGRFLATGGADKRIGIWSCGNETGNNSSKASSSGRPSWVKALTGHKDAISGLKFRSGSHELYSASLDRTIKLFDVDQLSYIETLFGHQESIVSLDALKAELAVSVGGRDRSARWWKIRDESQLVFRGGAKSKLRDVVEGGNLLGAAESQGRKIRGDRGGSIIEGSLDCVAMIDDSHFLTGGDSGAISLWSLSKKKPVYTRAATHGFDRRPRDGLEEDKEEDEEGLLPRWVTSLACLPYGDVFASGSWDGSIRLWSLDRQLRSFKPLTTIAAPGFVNSLQLFQPPRGTLTQPCVRPELYRFRVKSDTPSAAMAEVNGGAAEDEEEEKTAPVRLQGRKEAVPPILIAALGHEPRMARWMKAKKVRSGALIVPFSFKA